MPLRTSRISRPPLVGRKPVRKPKNEFFFPLSKEDMSQNLKSPNPDDKETRLERRWKRREAMNDSLKHNHVASATKTPAEICENTTILIDESDHTIDDDTNEDCEILLGECTGVNDEVEADYKSLLAKYSPVIETDSASNHIDGSDIVEVEADYGSLLAKYNPIIDRQFW
ncbi:uncharacterized protein [Medicago truncatula]|uniref:uncharacterized protein n=1 Tax=Medicago truncatula TaxID=3880 RepID=UPI001968963D|nr:uncharacterized protein LOC25482244 [Medicago truncatula]